MISDIHELATGRFYIDGEPEVRIRERAPDSSSAAKFLLVVTMMGDSEGPVGLTSSIFATSIQDVADVTTDAKEYISERIAQVGGRVLHQESESIEEIPADLTRFMVINLLQSAKRLLP